MEPQLALNYSSAVGNGLLGLGWTLSGPSAVTRCPKVKALDGERGAVTFGADDRYCLDGQRLVLVNAGPYGANASEYRTERDSFSRITAAGSYSGQATVPNSFRVETKSGLILEFGISTNSQVLTNFVSGVGTPPTVNRWMIQRISDRHGSFVEFVYCKGSVSADGKTCSVATTNWSGSTVLHYIRYTNRGGAVNGELSVLFAYEGRPDAIQGFHAGSAARQTQRLKSIETYRDFVGATVTQDSTVVVPGQLVRGYYISYEPLIAGSTSLRATNTSRVAQIQERDAAGNTLPPLAFAMAPDLVFGQPVAQQGTVVTTPPPPWSRCGGVVNGRLPLQCK